MAFGSRAINSIVQVLNVDGIVQSIDLNELIAKLDLNEILGKPASWFLLFALLHVMRSPHTYATMNDAYLLAH